MRSREQHEQLIETLRTFARKVEGLRIEGDRNYDTMRHVPTYMLAAAEALGDLLDHIDEGSRLMMSLLELLPEDDDA